MCRYWIEVPEPPSDATTGLISCERRIDAVHVDVAAEEAAPVALPPASQETIGAPCPRARAPLPMSNAAAAAAMEVEGGEPTTGLGSVPSLAKQTGRCRPVTGVEGSVEQRCAAGDADRDIVERQRREIELLKEQVNLLTSVVMHAECDGNDMDDAGCSPIDLDNELAYGIGQEHRMGIDATAGNRDECLDPVRPPQGAADAADGDDGFRASFVLDAASLPA